jgi:malate dehydrogenase (oxaloacetate-decarboxylating)(NADP+)
VVLSGFINAARLSSSAAGTPLTDQRILFFGAGSAGIGVAKQLMSFFTLLGLSEEEARSRIYVSNRGSLFIFVSVLMKLYFLDCRFQGIDYCR